MGKQDINTAITVLIALGVLLSCNLSIITVKKSNNVKIDANTIKKDTTNINMDSNLSFKDSTRQKNKR